jgi:uncharacterized protein (TIGR02680 family)
VTEPAVGDRWVPHRAGIRNVWEYDDQIFSFADGRLILRGPNGSGKSNALALLFPFLIDGTMSAAAMDPFAGGRSMKSLLLGVLRDDSDGRRYRHDQRLGYVWLEFRRPTTGAGHGIDVADHVTIGCGARARAQGDTTSWFFVTRRRVGFDLDLAPDGTPLTRPKLIDELSAGNVFETAEAYRMAVDRELFSLGPDRLPKLVNLIRVLRRPQLAGKLNLDLLSEVLSGGLPALDPNALEDVASSLDDLERVQKELADLRATLETVDRFLPVYRTYLSGEALVRGAAVVNAARSLAGAKRALTKARSDCSSIETGTAAIAEERQQVNLRIEESDARHSAHLESPAYQSAASLREVEESARVAAEAAVGASVRRNEAETRAADAQQRSATSTDRARQDATAATQQTQQALDLADAIDAPWTLTPEEQLDPERLAAATDIIERERRADLREVRAALADRDAAQGNHERAEQEASTALGTADDREVEARAAQELVREQRSSLAAQVSAWVDATPGLEADGAEELVGAVALLGEPGQPSLVERYRALTAAHRDELVAARARRIDRIEVLGTEAVDLRVERDQVAAEVDPGPTAPAWRTADRSSRPGAPLWACCDFAASVPDATDRAGIEAALDAAGLLDAWISPGHPADDASEADPDLGAGPPTRPLDAWLHPEPTSSTMGANTLASILAPSVPAGSGLDANDVRRVLTSISLGRAGIAVSTDGSFVLGPLRGRAEKPAPEFIGATARAERRQRRLADLDARLTAVADEVATEQANELRLSGEIAAIDGAADSLPPLAELQRALDEARRAEAVAVSARERAVSAEQAEAAAAARLASASAALVTAAGSARVDPSRDAIDRLDDQIRRFASVARAAVTARGNAISTAGRAETDQELAAQAEADLATRRDEQAECEREAVRSRARAETLRESLGADAEAPIRELERLDQRLRELRETIERLADDRSDLDKRLGLARGKVVEAEGAIGRDKTRLAQVEARLPVLRQIDLLRLIIGSAGDQQLTESEAQLPIEPVAFAAWLIDRADGPTPDAEAHRSAVAALDRAQKPLLDDLHRGYDPSISHQDDLVTVQITSDAGTFGLSVLADQLHRQEAELRTYLTEGDQKVFERFLLNRVAHELRRLLTEAEEFVTGVNQALDRTRTASGLRVELVWSLGTDDAGVREAVRLLHHDTQQMGDDDRAALRAFFDRAIKQQRADDPEAGYRVALERALDYRSWHDFRPYLRPPEGGRALLTKTKFRELSGGEQAVALHLPLFAAAAAHYARADPAAPRLVALDEAFAGIDEAMRGELMALTVQFDLDVILTGHELWGAYAEVPSIAVHDLLRRPPAEGVSVFSLRWDGAALVEQPDDAVVRVSETPRTGEPGELVWPQA